VVFPEVVVMVRLFPNAINLRKCRLRAQGAEMLGSAGNEQGSALVEFALSIIILLTLVFGVIAMCLAIYAYHFISDAAREGTRYAIVRGSSCATYGNFSAPCPVTTSAQVQTYVRSLAYPGINPNYMTITATWPTTGASCTPSVSPCNNPGNVVKVTVSYALPLPIPFVSARTLTMTSSSQMVIAD
jgi:Flp pilus assembly protein TadG